VYNPATGAGTISYSYTLVDNTTGDNTTASFAVVVTDTDGDSAPAGNLVINIIDDVPTAHADTDSVASNQFTAEAGNVLTAVGTTSPVTGIDVLGADGAAVVGVQAGDTNADFTGSLGVQIQGTYGKLTLTPTAPTPMYAMPARRAATTTSSPTPSRMATATPRTPR
ncbi:hypothetical protein NKK52_00005, partial [Mesorhizobium sp. C277A]|uniref:hypothetical protein n=1 Tax=Mesorhizobium sp. C277A TaxID=2956827 RepID=UPI00333B6C11